MCLQLNNFTCIAVHTWIYFVNIHLNITQNIFQLYDNWKKFILIV